MNNQAVTLQSQGAPLLRVDEHSHLDFLGYDHPGGGTVDLASLRSIIARNRWLMLAIFLLALAAGVASIVLTRPVYRGEASIQIEPQGLRTLGTENLTPDTPKTESDRLLQTQVDILNSRATAEHVAQKLGLASNRDFLEEAGLDSVPAGPALAAQVTTALQDRLSVSQPRETRVIKLGFDSHDPQLAARAANSFAETFIADSLQRRLDTYAFSRGFLQRQLAQTKARLENSERALLSYARSAGIIDASGAAGTGPSDGERRSLTTANLVNLNTAYAEARAARVQAQQRYASSRGTSATNLPEVLSNPAYQAMTERRAELESALQEERQRRMDEHPGIVQATARLREMDRQIGALAAGIKNSIGEQYRVAQRQESALNANIGQLKAATFAEQDKGVRYNILQREADTNKNLYNSLLKRFNEVSGQAADTTSAISIVDRAFPPTEPRYPQPALNMAVAGAGGLLLAFLAAFARNKVDTQVHGPAAIESEFGVPLLGVVPLLRKGETIEEAMNDPRSPFSESHHSICLGLEAVAGSPNHAALLLTSSSPTEGKSTTALKLAAHFAAIGKNVLLVDGDMRRGSLDRMLGLSNDSGLSDLLANRARAPDSALVQHCEAYGFAFLARGRSAANPAGLLAGERFADFLRDASREYDVVIIDGPPVLGLADAPRLAGLTDATLFVVEANRTSKQHARIALRRLAEAGATQLGVVLTKYDPTQDLRDYGQAYCYDYGTDLSDRDGEAAIAAPNYGTARKEPLVLG